MPPPAPPFPGNPPRTQESGKEGRTLVFVDESGLSTHPTQVRTWAPRGQTPVIQETFGWKSLSMIGGLALYRVHLQIHPGSIKGPQVIEFLRHLQRHIPGKRTVIWDGAPIHRSRLVQDYVAGTGGRIVATRLPAYAPELNPVEYMWGNLKTHQIDNPIATEASDLRMQATAAPPTLPAPPSERPMSFTGRRSPRCPSPYLRSPRFLSAGVTRETAPTRSVFISPACHVSRHHR